MLIFPCTAARECEAVRFRHAFLQVTVPYKERKISLYDTTLSHDLVLILFFFFLKKSVQGGPTLSEYA